MKFAVSSSIVIIMIITNIIVIIVIMIMIMISIISLPCWQALPVYPLLHWHSPLKQFPWLLQSGTFKAIWFYMILMF